jgi:hypothetical protein
MQGTMHKKNPQHFWYALPRVATMRQEGGVMSMSSRILLPARVFAVALATITVGAGALPAGACNSDGEQAIFSCEAAQDGYFRYRFGTQDKDGNEARVELAYPDNLDGSLTRFYAAVYTYKGVYTQSVRFTRGGYDYRVYTEASGARALGAGVEVRDRESGKTTRIACSERPRFSIWELKGLVACGPETPVGKACLK